MTDADGVADVRVVLTGTQPGIYRLAFRSGPTVTNPPRGLGTEREREREREREGWRDCVCERERRRERERECA